MKGYTIQHSIEKLEKAVENGGGGGGGSTSASNVTYDNTQSGLTATDVQAAVDELKTDLTTINTGIETLAGRFDYSTDEKIVGKWIDGRDIYKKSYVIQQTTEVSHSTFSDVIAAADVPENIDILIKGEILKKGQPGYMACDITVKTTGTTNTIAAQCAGAYDISMAADSVVTIYYLKTPVTSKKKGGK